MESLIDPVIYIVPTTNNKLNEHSVQKPRTFRSHIGTIYGYLWHLMEFSRFTI